MPRLLYHSAKAFAGDWQWSTDGASSSHLSAQQQLQESSGWLPWAATASHAESSLRGVVKAVGRMWLSGNTVLNESYDEGHGAGDVFATALGQRRLLSGQGGMTLSAGTLSSILAAIVAVALLSVAVFMCATGAKAKPKDAEVTRTSVVPTATAGVPRPSQTAPPAPAETSAQGNSASLVVPAPAAPPPVPLGPNGLPIKPWHATTKFSQMRVGSIEQSLLNQVCKAFIGNDKRVHDLSPAALEWKYGAAFVARSSINTRRCAGVGSTATVYCGTHNNQKAAFKVMNINKTAPFIMSMLQRSVLSELDVHALLTKAPYHEGRKHLLQVEDCFMFPPLDVVRSRVELDGNSLIESRTETSTSARTDSKVFEFAAHSLDNGLEMKNQHDMCVQIIMVGPLCEVGQLLKLCRGTLKIPSTTIPLECMTAVVNQLDDKEYQLLVKQHANQLSQLSASVRDVRSAVNVSQVLMDAWDSGEKAYLRVGQLPAAWFAMLKLQLLLQVLEAVQYLHDSNVIHCDVKLDNVFLTRDDRCTPFKLAAKLGDLGMCRTLDGAATAGASEDTMSSRFTTFVKGTPGYCAPEMFNNGHMSRATDIYSLAVLCSIALSPNAAFIKHSESDVQLVPRFPSDMHPRLRLALDAALGPKPKARPTLAGLKDGILEEMGRISDVLANTFDEERSAAMHSQEGSGMFAVKSSDSSVGSASVDQREAAAAARRARELPKRPFPSTAATVVEKMLESSMSNGVDDPGLEGCEVPRLPASMLQAGVGGDAPLDVDGVVFESSDGRPGRVPMSVEEVKESALASYPSTSRPADSLLARSVAEQP